MSLFRLSLSLFPLSVLRVTFSSSFVYLWSLHSSSLFLCLIFPLRFFSVLPCSVSHFVFPVSHFVSSVFSLICSLSHILFLSLSRLFWSQYSVSFSSCLWLLFLCLIFSSSLPLTSSLFHISILFLFWFFPLSVLRVTFYSFLSLILVSFVFLASESFTFLCLISLFVCLFVCLFCLSLSLICSTSHTLSCHCFPGSMSCEVLRSIIQPFPRNSSFPFFVSQPINPLKAGIGEVIAIFLTVNDPPGLPGLTLKRRG